MAKSTLRFTATIEIIGINPHVIVPDELAGLLAAAGTKALPVPGGGHFDSGVADSPRPIPRIAIAD